MIGNARASINNDGVSIINTYMENKINNAEEHSRNETRTVENIGMEHVNYSLMQKIKSTIGEPNSRNRSGFSLERLAEYFQCEDDPSNYVKWEHEDERQELYELFNDINERLQFILFLHHNAKSNLLGGFSSAQLSCIYNAFNAVVPKYEDRGDSSQLAILIDYIDHEGKSKYELGDVDAFKAQIRSLNPIEFEVLVNLIKEHWDSKDNLLATIKYLAKD
jgi:hypothetical protein